MNTRNLQTVFGVATATVCSICMMGQAAYAGSLHNGWNYAIDSFNDGVNGSLIGSNSQYEFYGMAVKEHGNTFSVAINANTPLGGWSAPGAGNNNIAWGDMLFNFTGSSLANANGNLFGIHFDAANDGTTSLGVYSNVTATSVGSTNNGFSTLSSHSASVLNKGGTPSMADLSESDPYFDNSTLNIIQDGTKIGDINLLNQDQLSNLGLDFGHFNATGDYTFGFSFDKSLLPEGNYIAHLFAECANDGMAIKSVPEPSSMTGLAMLGATLVGSQLRKRRKQTV